MQNQHIILSKITDAIVKRCLHGVDFRLPEIF